jgi:hypothetical protein
VVGNKGASGATDWTPGARRVSVADFATSGGDFFLKKLNMIGFQGSCIL